MIDSTNPRILANNIRRLFAKIIGLEAEIEAITPGSVVVANPEGESTEELSSLGIDGDKYLISNQGYNISSTEATTGCKFKGSDIYIKEFSASFTMTSNAVSWVDSGVSTSGIDKLVSGYLIDSADCIIPVQIANLSASNTIGVYTKVFGDRAIVALVLSYTKATVSNSKQRKK